MAAITKDEIIAELQSDFEEIDPSLDVRKGELRRVFIDPHAALVERERNRIDRLIALFTLQRLDNITSAELEAQTSAFGGLARFLGTEATGFVTFFTFSKPTNVDFLRIPVGSAISDETGTLNLVVSEEVSIPIHRQNANSLSIDDFFNPVTRRYEIQAPVRATEVGSSFSVPPRRITRVQSQIDGIVGVENNAYIDGGLDPEADSELDARFRRRLQGAELLSFGGILSEIFNIDKVSDVTAVTAEDVTLFSRRTERPAIDIYIIGKDLQTDSLSLVLQFPTRFIGLPVGRLVTLIQEVSVNGVVVPFRLVRDNSSTGGSLSASDTIELDTSAPAFSTVEVKYQYNRLLETAATRVATLNALSIFGTDVLVFEAKPVSLRVELDVTFMSASDIARGASSIRENLLRLLNSNKFLPSISPESVVENLHSLVPEANTIRPKIFRPIATPASQLPVQQIEFLRTQYSTLVTTDIKINTRA